VERTAPRRLRLVGVITALVLACSGWIGAARIAGATTTGGGSFSGTVTLPQFPCGNCNGGAFAGTGTISMTGLTMSLAPYAATWLDAPLTAGFGYNEACLGGQPSGTVPLVGTAAGSFSLTGGTVRVGLQTLTNATLSGSFAYHRVAAAVAMTLQNLVITNSAGTTVVANLINPLVGESAGAISWTNGPGECPGTYQSPQTASIKGVALEVA